MQLQNNTAGSSLPFIEGSDIRKGTGNASIRESKGQSGFPRNKARAAEGIPPYLGPALVDPSIVYAIQLTNAAADQINRMHSTLEALEPEKMCGWSEHLDDLGERVADVLDALIDFAASYAKMSV